MAWRVARSLNSLLDEVNARWPGRPRHADGTIGDTAHSARTSDHNPNDDGIVCARDITEWVLPDGTEINDVIAETIRKRRPPWVKYVISDGRMFASYDKPDRPAWTWGPYSGANAHTKHVHVSVYASSGDQARPWGLWPVPPKPAAKPTERTPDVQLPVLRRGINEPTVKRVQLLLNGLCGERLDPDGDFGELTEAAIKREQARNRKPDTGVVDEATWRRLLHV